MPRPVRPPLPPPIDCQTGPVGTVCTSDGAIYAGATVGFNTSGAFYAGKYWTSTHKFYRPCARPVFQRWYPGQQLQEPGNVRPLRPKMRYCVQLLYWSRAAGRKNSWGRKLAQYAHLPIPKQLCANLSIMAATKNFCRFGHLDLPLSGQSRPPHAPFAAAPQEIRRTSKRCSD